MRISFFLLTLVCLAFAGCSSNGEERHLILQKEFVGPIEKPLFNEQDSTVTIVRKWKNSLPNGDFNFVALFVEDTCYDYQTLVFKKEWKVSDDSRSLTFGKEDVDYGLIFESDNGKDYQETLMTNPSRFLSENWGDLVNRADLRFYFTEDSLSLAEIPSFAVSNREGSTLNCRIEVRTGSRYTDFYRKCAKFHWIDVEKYRYMVKNRLIEVGDILLFPKGQTPAKHSITDLKDAEAYFYY